MLTPASGRWRRWRLGLSNAQVARERGVSIHTVRAQVSSLLGKLALSDRRALSEWEGQMVAERTGNVMRRCSFCGLTDAKVEFLLAGPAGVHICGACVEACNRIIATARAAG